MGSVIKMYGAGDGDTDVLAQVDIPMSGSLIGLQWAVAADLDADVEYLVAQLSFRSTGTFTTNDDRGVISEVRAQISLTTSGVSPVAINNYVPLPDIPIAAGERLYLHINASAGLNSLVGCMLHFDFDIDKVSSRRR